MTRTIKSFKYAIKGLQTTWEEEFNFRVEVSIAFVVILCIFYFNFSFLEASLSVFAITLVLVLEIINTVVEDICNKIEPSQDPIIAKIKDISASFVFTGSLGALIVGVFVLLNHFTSLM